MQIASICLICINALIINQWNSLLMIIYLSWTEHIVHVFEETFIFDLIICEYECDSFVLTASCSVQQLQVFRKIAYIVWPVTQKVKFSFLRLTLLGWLLYQSWVSMKCFSNKSLS